MFVDLSKLHGTIIQKCQTLPDMLELVGGIMTDIPGAMLSTWQPVVCDTEVDTFTEQLVRQHFPDQQRSFLPAMNKDCLVACAQSVPALSGAVAHLASSVGLQPLAVLCSGLERLNKIQIMAANFLVQQEAAGVDFTQETIERKCPRELFTALDPLKTELDSLTDYVQTSSSSLDGASYSTVQDWGALTVAAGEAVTWCNTVRNNMQAALLTSLLDQTKELNCSTDVDWEGCVLKHHNLEAILSLLQGDKHTVCSKQCALLRDTVSMARDFPFINIDMEHVLLGDAALNRGVTLLAVLHALNTLYVKLPKCSSSKEKAGLLRELRRKVEKSGAEVRCSVQPDASESNSLD